MNGQKEKNLLVLHINLPRVMLTLVVAGLILATEFGFFTLKARGVAASEPLSELEAPQTAPAATSNGMRRYYRTFDAYYPTEAITACTQGYHFASLWEILDTSNLQYAYDHPDAFISEEDMGFGPPTGNGGYGRAGYIRTGYNSSSDPTPGKGNCNSWTSIEPTDWGTMAGLSYSWGTTEDIFVWDVSITTCDYRTGVWCVED